MSSRNAKEENQEKLQIRDLQQHEDSPENNDKSNNPGNQERAVIPMNRSPAKKSKIQEKQEIRKHEPKE